jgi:thiol-disulfide isomerase/thioredoxin
VQLTGFRQTEAHTFDDLFGRAVLLDSFASWCEPCARQVPDLNNLLARRGPSGLTVLGVTADEPVAIAEWVAGLGVEYAYAFDADLALHLELGFNPLPHAALLDAERSVVWQGNPGPLDPERLDQATRGALRSPVWEWPARAAAVRTALAQGRLTEAASAARTLEDWEHGVAVARLLDRMLERRTSEAEARVAAGDYLGARDQAQAWRERVTIETAHAPRARVERRGRGSERGARDSRSVEVARGLGRSAWCHVESGRRGRAATRARARRGVRGYPCGDARFPLRGRPVAFHADPPIGRPADLDPG